jgi:hypothetical protein
MGMLRKLFLLVVMTFFLVSCQFSETMIINEDGSGRMSIAVDMSEMMAMMPTQDSTEQKMDSVFSFKQVFEEKKDSIAQLPKAEQDKLKLLENYQMQILMDSETEKMVYTIFTDFTSVTEANNLMEGLSATGSTKMSADGSSSSSSSMGGPTEQATALRFSFENDVFERDGYITDPALFQKQMDSIKQMESFMDGAMYSVKYTFPKKIKKASMENAEISADGKTITFQQKFITYLKDPDALDIQIELEEK